MSPATGEISEEEWSLVRAGTKFRAAKMLVQEGIELLPATYSHLVPDDARGTVHNTLDRWIADLETTADACP